VPEAVGKKAFAVRQNGCKSYEKGASKKVPNQPKVRSTGEFRGYSRERILKAKN